jgi:hypothetical protein
LATVQGGIQLQVMTVILTVGDSEAVVALVDGDSSWP